MNLYPFLIGSIAGFIGAYLISPGSISHHAAAVAAAKSVPVNVAFTPDIACGGPPAPGKPAVTASINGVPFVAEIDSGAAFALLNPTAAAATKLTTFPKAGTANISFTGQAQNTFQGYNAPLSIPGLPPMTTTFYTGAQIGCNLIPTRVIEQTYIVGLGPNSVTFTHV